MFDNQNVRGFASCSAEQINQEHSNQLIKNQNVQQSKHPIPPSFTKPRAKRMCFDRDFTAKEKLAPF